MSQVKFNLIRQKCDNYKAKQPEAHNKIIVNEAGEKQQIGDFECFYPNYPYKCPVLLYDIDSPHVLEPNMPLIAHKGDLWGVKGFIQVNEAEVNILVIYCGQTKNVPLVFPDLAPLTLS